MAALDQRPSSRDQPGLRDETRGGEHSKKDMWSTMLDSVASGKRLPEKNMLVLGGSSESQKDFIKAISTDSTAARRQSQRPSRTPPIANDLALGYTYQDVLDADHEDILARMSLYLLTDPSPAFVPLLRPHLTPQTIQNMLVVILLDWAQPWSWLRTLRSWIRLLRALLMSLDDEAKESMEDTMLSWRQGHGPQGVDEGREGSAEEHVALPLGPGELDELLGIPLCVVCQNADQIEVLEKELGWKEEHFDFILQSLRTVLLKHGASLIYTSPSVPSPLQSLIHSSLGIQSLLKKQSVRHNVVERDKILVPPSWDSWGKIRVLRDGFEMEGISQGWSLDIQLPPGVLKSSEDNSQRAEDAENLVSYEEEDGAVRIFEDTIKDERREALNQSRVSEQSGTDNLEIPSQNIQDFLSKQLEAIETADLIDKEKVNQAKPQRDGSNRLEDGTQFDSSHFAEEGGKVNEHIGPVQFNMGGIQVDAEDMLKRLKEREAAVTPDREPPPVQSPDGKTQNEALASFFAGLMKRSGGSAASSPR